MQQQFFLILAFVCFMVAPFLAHPATLDEPHLFNRGSLPVPACWFVGQRFVLSQKAPVYFSCKTLRLRS